MNDYKRKLLIKRCMEMLASNKLYDPLIAFNKNDENHSPHHNKEVKFKIILF